MLDVFQRAKAAHGLAEQQGTHGAGHGLALRPAAYRRVVRAAELTADWQAAIGAYTM